MNLSLDPIAAWINTHAPAGTAVAVGPIKRVEPFDVIEAKVTERAVQIRRDEFHTGRRLARAALARLGCAPTTIPVGESRVPIWPPDFVGTISHSRALCVAHVGRAHNLLGMGVDMEPDAPLPNGFETLICRPDEGPPETGGRLLLRFVAKEAFFKAYFPAARAFLEFQDVRVEFDHARNIFRAVLLAPDKPALAGRRSFEGRFVRRADHFVAALWIPV